MKRHRIARAKNDTEEGIDIASLIDICFLLLIYFIVTTTIIPAERDLPMGPPGPPDESTPVEVQTLLISIDDAGQVFTGEGVEKVAHDADQSVRELHQLASWLEFYKQGLQASGQTCLVVIDAADEVKSQRVVDVLNALAGLEFNKVTFVDKEEE